MLYRRYVERTQKLAALLARLYRLRAVIIALLSVAVLSAVSLAATRGLILSDDFGALSIMYGDGFSCEAHAFLGKTRYEFRSADGGEWSEQEPSEIGEYVVRAVGRSVFGTPRYGAEHTLTVYPRTLLVWVPDAELVYGETPTLAADVCRGHTLSGEVRLTGLSEGTTAEITPLADSIRVTDAEGRDVSRNYTVVGVRPTTVTVLPRPILVTVADSEKTFDGLPLTFDGFEVTDGTLAAGDRLVAVVDDARTDVGTMENTPVMTVFNEAAEDMTHHYTITLREGTLTVNARPLHITTGDSETVYDGTAHTYEDFTVSPDTPLAEGHTLRSEAAHATEILHVGEKRNYLDFYVDNALGGDETANYSLLIRMGSLRVTPRPVEIHTASATFVYDGQIHTATALSDYAMPGDTLRADLATEVRDVTDGVVPNELRVAFYRDGVEVSRNYDITYVWGELAVTPRPVTVTTPTTAFVYDGTHHSTTELSETYAVSGDTLRVDSASEIREVAESGMINELTVSFWRDGRDVSRNYTVSYSRGTLSVTPRPVTIRSDDMAFIYDGEEHRHDAFTVTYTDAPDTSLPGLVGNDTATVHITGVCRDILRDEGDPTVYLPVPNTVDTTQTVIRDGERDVSANYTVTHAEGGLCVLPRPITVRGESASWLYDGQTKACPTIEQTPYWSEMPEGAWWSLIVLPEKDAALMEGDTVRATVEGSYTDACLLDDAGQPIPYENRVTSVSIISSSGDDRMGNYLVTPASGELTILPRPITVTTGEASKMYDGTPLMCSDYSIAWNETAEAWGGLWAAVMPVSFAEPCLLDGHDAAIVVTGSATRVVRHPDDRSALSVPNTVDIEASAIRRLGDGADVSRNYRVNYIYGGLTVTPRPIKVQTESLTRVYTDTGLHADGIVLHADSPYALPDGHVLRAANCPEFIEAGTYQNEHIAMIFQAQEPSNVTGSFDIEYVYGTVTIERRPITIRGRSVAKIYDGTPLTDAEFICEAASDSGAAPDTGLLTHRGHRITAAAFDGSQTDAGTSTNRYIDGSAVIVRVDGETTTDVTANYLIDSTEGTLEVKARPITLRTDSATLIYDGTAQACESYTAEHTDIDRNAPEWSAVVWPEDRGEPLVAGHTADLLFTTSCTDVAGSFFGFYLSVSNKVDTRATVIRTADGRDVTANYALSYAWGSLTLLPRPVTVVTRDGTWIYDGLPHTADGYEILWGEKPSGTQWDAVELPTDLPALAALDEASVRVTGRATDVAGGSFETGYAAHKNTVDASKTAFSASGRPDGVTDVSKNYLVVGYIEGDLTILPRPITVTTASGSRMYDGEVYTLHELGAPTALTTPLPTDGQWAGVTQPTGSALLEGHTLSLVYTGECTYVRMENGVPASVPNTARPIGDTWDDSWICLAGGEPGDTVASVAHNYHVTFVWGELTVTPRPLGVLCEDGTAAIYDGTPQTFPHYTCDLDLPGHTSEARNLSSFVNVGEYTTSHKLTVWRETAEGRLDVTDSFAIRTTAGTVRIVKRPVMLRLESTKVYNGYLQRCDQAVAVVDEPTYLPLAEGHFATASTLAEMTEPGWMAAEFVYGTARIYDRRNNDVTENYDILRYDWGRLTILPREITVTTASARKSYDGTPLIAPSFSVGSGTDGRSLVEGHILTLDDVTGRQLMPGISANTCNEASLRIIDERGQDVTHCYKVTFRLGTLEVTNGDEPDRIPEGGGGDFDVTIPEDTATLMGYVRPPQSGKIYLRMTSAGDYLGDARRWGYADVYEGTMANGYSLAYLPYTFLSSGEGAREPMQFRDMRVGMMPYYPSTDSSSKRIVSSDVTVSMIHNSYEIYYATPASTLEWLASFRRLDEEARRAILGEDYEREQDYRAWVYGQYLAIGDDTLSYMQSVIAEQSFSADDPGILTKVAYFIKHSATYNLQYDRALDEAEDVAVAFLRDFDEGICVHYAASATMLFRALGIPARYTTGFLVEASADEWTEIWSGGEQNMAHAWVEVYIDGFGWVTVEVTGSADGSDDGEELTPQPKPVLHLQPVYLSKEYDGEPLKHNGLLDESGLLGELVRNGYTYRADISGSIAHIGTTGSSIHRFNLYDPFGNNVTDAYILEYGHGILEVSALTLDIYVYQHTKEYDATPLVIPGSDYHVFDLPAGLILELELRISMTDVGKLTLSELNADRDSYVSYTVKKGEEDVTDSVTLRFVNVFREYAPNEVIAEVTPRLLELTANSKTAAYTEGAILRDDGWRISKNDPAAIGHRIDEEAVIVLGQCTDPRTVAPNRILPETVVIYDRDGRDVTANYDIRLLDGYLQFMTDDE